MKKINKALATTEKAVSYKLRQLNSLKYTIVHIGILYNNNVGVLELGEMSAVPAEIKTHLFLDKLVFVLSFDTYKSIHTFQVIKVLGLVMRVKLLSVSMVLDKDFTKMEAIKFLVSRNRNTDANNIRNGEEFLVSVSPSSTTKCIDLGKIVVIGDTVFYRTETTPKQLSGDGETLSLSSEAFGIFVENSPYTAKVLEASIQISKQDTTIEYTETIDNTSIIEDIIFKHSDNYTVAKNMLQQLRKDV